MAYLLMFQTNVPEQEVCSKSYFSQFFGQYPQFIKSKLYGRVYQTKGVVIDLYVNEKNPKFFTLQADML